MIESAKLQVERLTALTDAAVIKGAQLASDTSSTIQPGTSTKSKTPLDVKKDEPVLVYQQDRAAVQSVPVEKNETPTIPTFAVKKDEADDGTRASVTGVYVVCSFFFISFNRFALITNLYVADAGLCTRRFT